MLTKFPQNFPKFQCLPCEIQTNNKKDFNNHLLTAKHARQCQLTKPLTNFPKISPISPDGEQGFSCKFCKKVYKSRVGIWKHTKICRPPASAIDQDILSHKEWFLMLMKQNSDLLDLVKNASVITTTTTNSHNTNCNNKAFNLNVFLNETCKDAMNIADFVDSIKIQLGDIERFGEVGYVEGLSNIITANLKEMDVTERPVHCTDKKRETIYIKDDNKWEKEDDNKTRLRKAIKRIASKNYKLLPAYREKYPGCQYAASQYSDKYNKMMVEVMGGAGNNDLEKEDKIIHKISQIVVVDK